MVLLLQPSDSRPGNSSAAWLPPPKADFFACTIPRAGSKRGYADFSLPRCVHYENGANLASFFPKEKVIKKEKVMFLISSFCQLTQQVSCEKCHCWGEPLRRM